MEQVLHQQDTALAGRARSLDIRQRHAGATTAAGWVGDPGKAHITSLCCWGRWWSPVEDIRSLGGEPHSFLFPSLVAAAK